jgi:hypothetical protein
MPELDSAPFFANRVSRSRREIPLESAWPNNRFQPNRALRARSAEA